VKHEAAVEMQMPAPDAPTCRTKTCCAVVLLPLQHHVQPTAASAAQQPCQHTNHVTPDHWHNCYL